MRYETGSAKMYYSISEVSEMTSLKPYVLRYWESEFPSLRPSKNRAGKRIYRSSDVDQVLAIKKLLYEKKFTIEGAKTQLKSAPDNSNEPRDVAQIDDQKGVLAEIRTHLKEIVDILEDKT